MNTCGKCKHWNFKVSDSKAYGHCMNPKLKDMTHISALGTIGVIREGLLEFFDNLKRCTVFFNEQFGCRFWESDNETISG